MELPPPSDSFLVTVLTNRVLTGFLVPVGLVVVTALYKIFSKSGGIDLIADFAVGYDLLLAAAGSQLGFISQFALARSRPGADLGLLSYQIRVGEGLLYAVGITILLVTLFLRAIDWNRPAPHPTARLRWLGRDIPNAFGLGACVAVFLFNLLGERMYQP